MCLGTQRSLPFYFTIGSGEDFACANHANGTKVILNYKKLIRLPLQFFYRFNVGEPTC